MLDDFKKLLQKYPDAASFFKMVSILFAHDPKGQQLILKALRLSLLVYGKQKRLNGDLYMSHVIAVALYIMFVHKKNDPSVIAAALIHDLLEDIPGWNVIRVWCLFNLKVAVLTYFVSKQQSRLLPRAFKKELFYTLLSTLGPVDSKLIKLGDRTHNLLTIEGIDRKRAQKVLKESSKRYVPLALTLRAEHPEAEMLLKEAIKHASAFQAYA